MHLQKEDWETAWVLQQELKKRCPNDKVIAGFDLYLPESVKEQMQAKNQKKDEESEYDEEYDEEEESEEEPVEKDSSSEDEEEEQKLTEEELAAKQKKYREELGDPGDGFEWASDVDSRGRPLWKQGVEGEDWDFYYQEDKDAYEKGESTLPPLLNPSQIFDKNYTQKDKELDRMKMLSSVTAKYQKDDGAIYRVKKKMNRTGGGHVYKKD